MSQPNFPSPEDLKDLPVTSPAKLAESLAAQKQRGGPPQVLLDSKDFVQLLDAMLGLEITPRTLRTLGITAGHRS